MADLHHHSDYMDGRTPPEYLVVAQSAFGLDFIVVSDHDFVGNCPVIEIYATMRNKTFICSVEISPPWAHFNAYPILYPERLRFKGTMREIIEAARAAGALVIRANHPYIGGLFIAQELGSIPGGYYEDWDVAEISGPWGTDDNRTFTKMMTLWNMGIRKYLTAGSDVHDVWATPRSGFPRVVAYLPEGPSVVGLARAELTGRTFITYGPFVFTNPLPGTTIPIRDLSSNITISAKLFAVWNLSRVEVWSLGRLVRTIPLSGESADVNIELPAHLLVNPNRGFGWVLLIVYDTRGNRAITNPIWIDLTVYTTEQPSTITETVTTTLTETLKETVVVKEVVERTTTLTVQSTVVETEYVTIKDVVTVVETLVETETKHITATITETTQAQQPALTIGVGVVALLVGLLIGRAILTTKPK